MTMAVAGTITTSNVVGIDNVPGASEIVVASTSGSNTIVQVFSLASGFAQVGTTTTITGVSSIAGICMLSSTLCLCVSNSSSTCYVVNISTNTVTNVTGGGTYQNTSNGASNQQIASVGSGVGYFLDGSGNVVQINGTAGTATVMSLSYMSGEIAICIIAKSTTGYIIGTQRGRIIETDTSMNLVHQYMIPMNVKIMNYEEVSSGPSFYTCAPVGMNYYAGYLICSTNWGVLILFDHDTGIELQRKTVGFGDGTVFGPMICNSGIQEILVASPYYNNSVGTPISEFDFMKTPVSQAGQIFGDTTDEDFWKWIGINSYSGNIGWGIGNFLNPIYIFTLSGLRTMASHTVSINSLPGEVRVIEDDGVGSTSVMFHGVVPAAGKSIPMTASKNVIVIGGNGNGAGESDNVARFTS